MRTRPLTGSLLQPTLASGPTVVRPGECVFVIAPLAAKSRPENALIYGERASGATYIESDPIGLRGGINPHAYVGGNPLSRIDPLGLCDDDLSEIIVTAHKMNDNNFQLGPADYYGALAGLYTSVSDVGLERLGIESEALFGVKYGLPSLVSDIPGGLGSAIGLAQTVNAYSSGNYLEASQAGGATLGGIGGVEFGTFLGGFGGPAAPVTVPLGAVVFGILGAYGGGSAAGAIYNRGFMPLDQPPVPTPPSPF